MQNPITIYYNPLSGHAHRAILFASLAGIPFELKAIDLQKRDQFEPEFRKLNPLCQVPVIIDDDQVVWDSNAILVYLALKYAPQFLPTDPVAASEVQKVLTWAAGDMAFGLSPTRVMNIIERDFPKEFVAKTSIDALDKVEMQLENREFMVADKVTIADVATYTYTFLAPEGGSSLDPYPNIRRFHKTIEALPGFYPMVASKVGLRA